MPKRNASSALQATAIDLDQRAVRSDERSFRSGLWELPLTESEMQDDRAEAIRQRAYALWELEGRPDGKDLEHWLRAEAEISCQKYHGVTDNGKFIEYSSGAADPTPRRRSRSR